MERKQEEAERGVNIMVGDADPLFTPASVQIQVGVGSSGFVHTRVCGHVCKLGMLPHFLPPGCSETEAPSWSLWVPSCDPFTER